MIQQYKLVHRKPVPFKHNVVTDPKRWAREYYLTQRNCSRRIRLTYISEHVFVSTVFLEVNTGLDESRPMLFETMAFNKGDSLDCERASTHRKALKMHREMVKRIKKQM